MTAAQQWADELAAWAIDPEILAAAPEPPDELPPEVFAAGQDRDAVAAGRARPVGAAPRRQRPRRRRRRRRDQPRRRAP